MSSASEPLERSVEVEHPVTVIFLDEEDDGDGGKKREDVERDCDEERIIEIFHAIPDQDRTDWIRIRRGSADWSVEDGDPCLIKVNVVVDNDEERDHDDEDDGDDYNNDCDTSATASELFRSTGSQMFRAASAGDVFLSADDSVSNVGIQGQLTRRKFEIVEHETTRKCVVLAANTQLDSNDEPKEEPVVTATSDHSVYDVAAALYQFSIKDQGSVLPVVVFKMDSETQTSRNRTTQTGVDQSTMTKEELKQGARRRRRHRQRNPIDCFRGTGQRYEDEHCEQRAVAFEDDDQVPETTAVHLSPRGTNRGVAIDQGFSDDRHSKVAIMMMTEKVSVGQQTPSHTSTQTPVLVRLDADGSLWMPQEAVFLAGLENISTGTDRFYYPLGNRASDHYEKRAPPRCRGNERSTSRNFSTQTFGQMSGGGGGGGVHAETQTLLVNGCRDDDVDFHGDADDDDDTVYGNDVAAKVTPEKTRPRRRRHDKNRKKKKKGEDMTKGVKGYDGSKEIGDAEDGMSFDESKTDLLKLMLHQIRTLKRQTHRTENDNRAQKEEEEEEELEKEEEKGGGYPKHRRSPRNLVDTERNPADDRRRCSTKTRDSIDRVRRWRKQLERIDKNRSSASRRDDLEGRHGYRRRSDEREWQSADETYPRRSRLTRRHDDRRSGNAGKGRSVVGQSSDVERIRRSLTPPPSKGRDLFRQANEYLPNGPQHDAAALRTRDLFQGRHHPSRDHQANSRHPFRPLGASSPAIALDLGRDLRLSGSPAVGGGDVRRTGSVRWSMQPRGEADWYQRWRENIDPNSMKRHPQLL